MEMRRRLCENGFSFEYSATFGQAVKGNKNLEQEYARCTIFDYSYKYFYKDGYGKEYRILNLEDDSDESIRRRYLTACLLAFYQQQKLYSDREPEFRRFLIERPLWTFVGGSVNAVRTRSGRKVSDVTDILLFLAHFIGNRDESVSYLDLFLKGQSGLLDASGNDTFARVFTYLYKQGFNGEQVFDDILNVMFNASSPASLHVENLKGTDGEIALHLGNNEPFGVINVGDATALCNLCEEYDELVVTDREFSGSLFHGLSDLDSEINVLIGSKKFTEGWNSWRVSTMGMMNIGRSEGPQIIQLFGRGVRLKGLNLCLKRSRRIPGIKAPDDIDLLETLNIFGIRADYMRQFKEYLEEEGLPANEDRIEFVLPVIKNLGTNRLKMIRLPENIDFKQDGPKPTLELLDDFMRGHRITLDWYPRIQTLSSPDGETGTTVEKHESYFTEKHLAFMDMDEIYFELQRFKNERGWSNLNLLRPEVGTLLNTHGWYRLYIPEEEMEFRTFEQVRRWQEIATVLLKKYCDRYYKFRKSEYEDKHLEYRELTTDDPNFIDEYRFLVEQSKDDIIAKLEELKDLVTSGQLQDWEFQGMRAIRFASHLYYPLVYTNSDLVEVKPVILAEPGERDFVLDLQKFCQGHREFFHDKELYLLRNLSRGRGIGFFEAGNFHPDFILWLLSGKRQYISFVDPKGITRLEGLEDPKISFHKTIKELEDRLGDSSVTLNSFIVSSTLPSDVSWWDGGITKTELERKNVLFQYEDRDTYVGKLLAKAEYR